MSEYSLTGQKMYTFEKTEDKSLYKLILISRKALNQHGPLSDGVTFDDVLVFQRTFLNTSILTRWYFGDLEYVGRLDVYDFPGDFADPPKRYIFLLDNKGNRIEKFEDTIKRHINKKMLFSGIGLGLNIILDAALIAGIASAGARTAKEIFKMIIKDNINLKSATLNVRNVEYGKQVADTILDCLPFVSTKRSMDDLSWNATRAKIINDELLESFKK